MLVSGKRHMARFSGDLEGKPRSSEAPDMVLDDYDR
jgi:hypothetical protein